MIPSRRLSGGLVVVAALCLTSCAQRRSPIVGPVPAAETPLVGLYKSRLESADGDPRRFRLLLFAALPDRFHGEVLTPLGSTRLILDGGGGRLAVTFVHPGVSYVGPAGADDLKRILGIPLTLEDLVSGLVRGEARGRGYTLERSGPMNSLPEQLEIRTEDSVLSLRLKRARPLGVPAEELGRGRPPEGTEVRALDRLADEVALGELAGSEDDG